MPPTPFAAQPDERTGLDDGDTIASVRALYEEVIAESAAIVERADLDTVDESGLNNRWILLHLIEELARHAGHADILRESLDGAVGV